MDLLLLTVTDAEGTVLLSTYQTRLVCAYLIHSVPWLKSSHILEILPLVHAAATDDLYPLCVCHQGHQP